MGKSKNSKDEADENDTALRFTEKMLKALRIRAIEEEKSVQKITEMLVEDYPDRRYEPDN